MRISITLGVLTAVAVFCMLAFPAHSREARNPCDAKYDTLYENYCLHNPSGCGDKKWKDIAAKCGIEERAEEGLCARNPEEFGPCPKKKERK